MHAAKSDDAQPPDTDKRKSPHTLPSGRVTRSLTQASAPSRSSPVDSDSRKRLPEAGKRAQTRATCNQPEASDSDGPTPEPLGERNKRKCKPKAERHTHVKGKRKRPDQTSGNRTNPESNADSGIVPSEDDATTTPTHPMPTVQDESEEVVKLEPSVVKATQTGEISTYTSDPIPEPAVTTQPSVHPESQFGDTTTWNTDHQRPLMPTYTKDQ